MQFTFKELAVKVLAESKEPMSSKEIWELIKHHFAGTKAKTPYSTFGVILEQNSINTNLKNKLKNSIFLRHTEFSPVKYSLLPLNQNTNFSNTNLIEYNITSELLNWKLLNVKLDSNNILFNVLDCHEYTYILADNSQYIKIGKTSQEQPEKRLNQLRTGNPDLNFLIVFPSITYKEKDLHSKFDNSHYKLEFFFKTKDILNFIISEQNKISNMLELYNLQNAFNIKQEEILNKYYKNY